MPYCTNCGSEVKADMLFCHNCGSKLTIPKDSLKNNIPHANTTDTEVDKRKDISNRGIKRSKLYKQWVKYANLPSEEAPSMKPPRDVPVRGESGERHPYLFYVLIGVGILICIALAILLMKFW